MKITFFGTSHGVPELKRKCSSTLIEVGENRYIIDMGTQSIEQLIDRKIPIDSIKSIFITHMHGDHTNGLISFFDICSWYFKQASPKVFLPGDVERSKEAIRNWLGCNGIPLRDFEFNPVKAGTVYDDGIIRVTAFRTKHIDFSYAYLIEAENKRLLFSGDLYKNPTEDFPVSVLDQPLELAVCECAHFNVSEYLPIFENSNKIKTLCFNHYLDNNLTSLSEIKSLLPDTDVICATDNMEITV